jgi:soluble lytic murein transglycosylase-like protein
VKKFLFFMLLCTCTTAVICAKPPDWNEPPRIRAILTEQGARHGLPRGLSHCVSYTESRFIPNAKSEVVNGYRSCGVMQTYRKYLYGEKGFIARYSSKSQEDFRWDDPTDNAEIGCGYLAYLTERFGGSVYLGLVAYRWGETNLAGIKSWSEIPEYARDYARVILKNLDDWQEGW